MNFLKLSSQSTTISVLLILVFVFNFNFVFGQNKSKAYAWKQAENGGGLFISNPGRIGIGTSTPQKPIHIFRNRTGGDFPPESNAAIALTNRVKISIRPIFFTWETENADDKYLIKYGFATDQNEIETETKLAISGDGNVGIGTSTPEKQLHIKSIIQGLNQTPATIRLETTRLAHRPTGWDILGTSYNLTFKNFGVASKTINFTPDGGIISNTLSSANGNFVVTGDGNVGIGTTTPDGKLDVAGLSKLNGIQMYNDANITNIDEIIGFNDIRFSGSNDKSTDMYISSDGKVGINKTNPETELDVAGTIKATKFKNDNFEIRPNGYLYARELIVQANGPFPDYVFEQNYKPISLKKLETFIKENKHLPEIPSAKEVAKDGIKIGEMNTLLLKKVEELTLYIIEQNKRIEKLEGRK